jgi:hypothetical protein
MTLPNQKNIVPQITAKEAIKIQCAFEPSSPQLFIVKEAPKTKSKSPKAMKIGILLLAGT